MKKIVFGVIIGVVVTLLFSAKLRQKSHVPIYNRIKNDKLIECISNFIERGKGTHIDSVSKFLILEPVLFQEDENCWRLTYLEDIDHVYYQDPIIVCEPIKGKKIILGTTIEYTFIAETRVPDMGEYFKYELPNEYKKFMQKCAEEDKSGYRMYNIKHNHGKRELRITISGYELIDTTYINYDSTK